jgi:hypothetical protein
MIPEEKAKEIFDKMYFVDDVMGNYPMCFDTAKKCALIAVDEILQAIDWHKFETPNVEIDFWQEVKNELLKMK